MQPGSVMKRVFEICGKEDMFSRHRHLYAPPHLQLRWYKLALTGNSLFVLRSRQHNVFMTLFPRGKPTCKVPHLSVMQRSLQVRSCAVSFWTRDPTSAMRFGGSGDLYL